MLSSIAALKDMRLQRPSILTIFSVLLPGAALIAEILAAFPLPRTDPGFDLQDSVLGLLPDAALGAITVAVAIGLAYPVGLVSREFGYWLLRRRPIRSSPRQIVHALEDFYGAEVVGEVLREHPALAARVNAHRPSTERDADHHYVLSYAKQWLEVFARDLSVGGLETEINMLIAIPMPALLAPVAVLRLLGPTVTAGLVSIGAVVLAISALEAAKRRRYFELERALRHFFYAQLWAGTTPLAQPK